MPRPVPQSPPPPPPPPSTSTLSQILIGTAATVLGNAIGVPINEVIGK